MQKKVAISSELAKVPPKVRVTIFVPEGIHKYILESCNSFLNADKGSVPDPKTISEQYVYFLRRGVARVESDSSD